MKVRKIAALAVGAAMVGATMGFASAQANLPGKDFFVKDGQPNVKIVVGSQAAAMDVASAADIAVALGSLLYTEKEAEAAGVSVLVKKDVTYDPDDLVIYKYDYSTAGTITATKWDELPSDKWWNGSAYNGSYDEWVAAYQADPWKDEVEDMDKLEGDAQIDWDLSIDEVHLDPTDPDGWDESDIAQPPKDAKLSIPAGAFKVLLNYTISNWSVTVDLGKDSQWGIPKSKTFNVIDDDRPDEEKIADEYDVDPSDVTVKFENYVYKGIKAGETFTVLGNEYYVLEVLDDGIKYGTDWGQQWFHVGDVKEFDGYKIKAVDISVSPSNKALFEITAPDGRSDLIIISTDDGDVDISEKSDKFEPGEVVLKLDDTFVGIDGNLIAQLEVRTNVVTVKSGDEFVSGWVADFEIKDGYVKWITLSNKDDIDTKEVDVLGKYKVYYKFETYTKKESDANYDINGDGDKKDTLITAKAKIVIEPTERVYKTEELKVGDELEGWTIEDIKGGTYTEVTVMHPTEPITYLDTEIDPENIDSNLILVGGPVANAITKYLVDNGYSTVDWYNSAGDIEYIEDYNGFGVLIVAGKDRYATREAAKQLMEYLAKL